MNYSRILASLLFAAAVCFCGAVRAYAGDLKVIANPSVGASSVSAEELKGGTFTISNQGGIGGAHFTPIINKPEVAILGLGRGALKAMVRGTGIEPRLMLPIGLSYDHRVIDGGAAARFTVDLVAAFQNFSEADVKPA